MDFGVFLLSYILQFSYLIMEDFVKHFRITEISDSKSLMTTTRAAVITNASLMAIYMYKNECVK